MQTNNTFIIPQSDFLNISVEEKKPSTVAHLCQTPGALHFYASDVCVFCNEHRAPWVPGDVVSPSCKS